MINLYYIFNKDMRVPNKYTLPYGVVELHTKVISLEYREGTMKFIYELYDQEHLVTKSLYDGALL